MNTKHHTRAPRKHKTTRPRGFIENYAPQEKTRQLIALVRAVLDEYAEQLPLTLRQIFYRLVARHGFAKTERDYKRLADDETTHQAYLRAVTSNFGKELYGLRDSLIRAGNNAEAFAAQRQNVRAVRARGY